jgi:hypothetical protein
MRYKVPSKCIADFFRVFYVNVNVKSYKTTRVWKEGDKLFTNVYKRVTNSSSMQCKILQNHQGMKKGWQSPHKC